MKIILHPQRRGGGFVLLLVLMLVAFSLIILAGVMSRTSTVSLLNQRSTQLNVLDNAAEAAVEKVYARMAWDFQSYGPGLVTNNLTAYRALVPNSSDNAYWGNFVFSDPSSGSANSVYVSYVTNYNGPLPTQFTNQLANNSPIYRIACNVTQPNSLVNVIGTAQEDVMLAQVPITTYAIFYNGELEFSDCAPMTVNGRVHSNADICVGAGSSSTLAFNGPVTCCSTVAAPQRGGVNLWTVNNPSTWATTFNAGYATNGPIVGIAIQMTNTHSIIDIPPAGESVMGQQGLVRLYNQAQVVLVVTNPIGATAPTVLVRLQTAYNGALPGADPSAQPYVIPNATDAFLDTNSILKLPFLSLTNTFADARQHQTSQFVTQIDVNQYNQWLTTNSIPKNKFAGGSPATILYVADRRNLNNNKQSVVRLVNGSRLPLNTVGGINLGFTVATQNPIYIWGNYNTTINSNTYATTLGSTTNGASVPAAVLADAVTLLSPSWTDANSTASEPSRQVNADMTFNAALVVGNIPTTGTDAHTFSGGVHNVTRFLEDWASNNRTLTLNTSIVVLYSSTIATNQFIMPYSSSETDGYYNPPTRNWGFDQTYYSPNKQPPGVPCALVPIRYNWTKPAPNSVASN
jgi:hypothetical protein